MVYENGTLRLEKVEESKQDCVALFRRVDVKDGDKDCYVIAILPRYDDDCVTWAWGNYFSTADEDEALSLFYKKVEQRCS